MPGELYWEKHWLYYQKRSVKRKEQRRRMRRRRGDASDARSGEEIEVGDAIEYIIEGCGGIRDNSSIHDSIVELGLIEEQVDCESIGAPRPPNLGCLYRHHRAAAVVNKPNPSQPADDALEVVAVVVPERCSHKSPCAFPIDYARKPQTAQASEQLHQTLNVAPSALGRASTGICISPRLPGK
ncbi:hypothetical protein Scep_002073 [Stephania cephalantha]|uniref:Uncharacterized protein n=1 Tax=Stephania cephalantha TaxID=152367 RepID=A0AAP0Q3Z5_9MAGN